MQSKIDLVRRPVEVGALQHLDDVGDRVLAQQHAAEHRLLRGDVLRRLPVVLRRRRGRPAEVVGHRHGLSSISLRARPHHHSVGKPEFGGRRRTEHVFGSLLPPGTDISAPGGIRFGTRRQLGRTLGTGGPPSNTGVHADLHNLWTSRWTEACRHVETAGDTARVDVPSAPLAHLHGRRPPACGRKKLLNKFRDAPHEPHEVRGRPGTGPRLGGGPGPHGNEPDRSAPR